MHNIEGTERLVSQIIGEIIRKKMNLPEENVWLRDQNRLIPNTNGVFVTVGMINVPAVIASQSYLRDASANDWDEKNGRWDLYGAQYDMKQRETNFDVRGQEWDRPGENFDQQPAAVIEVSKVYQRENIQVDFMCRGNAGIKRNWEVVAALNSILSQQMQAYYSFKIFRLPLNFVNTSLAEGGSQLNRYTITFPTFVWYEKESLLSPDGGDYYDSFPAIAKTDGQFKPTNYDQDGGVWDGGGRYDNLTPPTPEVIADFEINQEGIEQ